MKTALCRSLALQLLAACLAWPASARADASAVAEYRWRAPLELPAGASLARVAVPAAALMQMQSPGAADLRVFDGQGQPVAFAFAAPPATPAPAAPTTGAYAALPLYSVEGSSRPGKGALQVHISEPGAQRSVWVSLDGTAAPAQATAPSARLPSVLFDTRKEKQPLGALRVKADFPPNAPVRVSVSTSTDLAQWTPVPVKGRLYRFEGEDAPANDRLEFAQPLNLEGRYLRLEWHGQQGVTVSAVTGVVALPGAGPAYVSAPLPPAGTASATALEWELGFATPLAQLTLSTPQPNALVPVRILGRNDAAQPWRVLAHSVVYRLGSNGGESVSGAVTLPRLPVRWLRVEATHGLKLEGLSLAASAGFDPLQLVFVASGSGPYELAVGRAGTPAAALPVHLLAASVAGKLDQLPQARVGEARQAPPLTGPLAAMAPWLPPVLQSKAAWLWAVLLAGVALLGGVAWSLLRQLKQP